MHFSTLILHKPSRYKDTSKRKKVTILIDYGITHNFINYKVAKYLNFFIYPAPKFQVMIADGGTINCLGKFHSIKLNMGEYFFDIPMISNPNEWCRCWIRDPMVTIIGNIGL
jgi:hypothetical protein